MKTNIVMKSADRNLFGIIIKQNTKNGQKSKVSVWVEREKYIYDNELSGFHRKGISYSK